MRMWRKLRLRALISEERKAGAMHELVGGVGGGSGVGGVGKVVSFDGSASKSSSSSNSNSHTSSALLALSRCLAGSFCRICYLLRPQSCAPRSC